MKHIQHYSTIQLAVPMVRETSNTTPSIRNPAEIYEECKDIRDMAQESFHVIMLNGKNRAINRVMVSLGILDACLVHPREVFRQAIIDQAQAIVIVHNHPSGDPTPSAEDIRITKQLVEAGRIIGIKVIDHVVIGREIRNESGVCEKVGFQSVRESGMVEFG